jgi:DNA-binding CsgD family transcriptional regulator
MVGIVDTMPRGSGTGATSPVDGPPMREPAALPPCPPATEHAAAGGPVRAYAPPLLGRQAECRQLARLVEAVRRGESRALVISGEAGIGKSALLDVLVAEASGCRVVRACGIQAEAELAFAGLHQLCTPLLDGLGRIPAPQRQALDTAFGLRAGPGSDPFLLRLAVLSLLTEAAAERPLVCVVDDAHWLDPTSRDVLAFAGRRLVAESVALVFAVRDPADDPSLAGLPLVALGGLPAEAARELLATAVPGPLDERVRDRVVVETRGNPLALLEMPQGLTYVELAGGFGLPGAEVSDRMENNFRRRLAGLPSDPRRLLLIAAVDPTGDPPLIHRAASRLGITVDERDPTAYAGLLNWGTRVTFRHTLARSAVYRGASPDEQREAHRALAEATDPVSDPDRRAWHLAHATRGPDEELATQLERCAGRAQDRGGLAAAAAFLELATHLTPSLTRRVQRALAAAQLKFRIGAFDATSDLLGAAEEGTPDALQRARIDLLSAKVGLASGDGPNLLPMLLAVARRLEPLDARLARATYLDAIAAAMVTGWPAGASHAREVAEAARRAPAPRQPCRVDLLLNALTLRFTDGYAAAAPLSKRAVRAFCGQNLSAGEECWLWLAAAIAADLWDDEGWDVLTARQVRSARRTGAPGELARALNARVVVELLRGSLPAAATLDDEARAVSEAVPGAIAPDGALWLAAWRGRDQRALQPGRATMAEAAAPGPGIGVAVPHTAGALLANGSGEYRRAMADARRAGECFPELAAPNWALTEVVEAAVRVGDRDVAVDAFARLAPMTRASGTAWALGIEARSRALLSSGDGAETLYREAIERLGRTRIRTDLARARLLYGEWLRRRRRPTEARDQLRTAHEIFTATGAEAFAERAQRELATAGGKARKRTVAAKGRLTAREAQIARLAGDGLSNPEISTRLFLSPRTVEYHLGNVFAKLGITSRHQVGRALTGAAGHRLA